MSKIRLICVIIVLELFCSCLYKIHLLLIILRVSSALKIKVYCYIMISNGVDKWLKLSHLTCNINTIYTYIQGAPIKSIPNNVLLLTHQWFKLIL